MYLIFTFLSIFIIFSSSGHQHELSLSQNGERILSNQDYNPWPMQTMHTVQGKIYGEALRNVHAKPCHRRRNFQNSDEMQGLPTFTSRITKPLIVNVYDNLKSQSFKDFKSDPNIVNEINKVNKDFYLNQSPNNNLYMKTRNHLSSNIENRPLPALLDTHEEDEAVSVPEPDVTDYVLENNNDQRVTNNIETSIERDDVLRSVENEVSETLVKDEKNLNSYNDNYSVSYSKENDSVLSNFENDDHESSDNENHAVKNVKAVLPNVESSELEIISRSGTVPEDEVLSLEANFNAGSLTDHCLQKSAKTEDLNEPSRRFLTRPDEPVILVNKKQIIEPPTPVNNVNKKQNKESLEHNINSQSINVNLNRPYNSGANRKVDTDAVRDKPMDETELNEENALEENENTFRSQINKQPSGGQLEPTRGLGISSLKESRVMLMKNTRVCYACSTIDNPTCLTPNRRTTVKYCRKEHNACVTKTFAGANSLIVVRDCGSTCNDPGITGLVPKYKSCSICHSDLCNGAYSVNSHNLMLVLFLISVSKMIF